MRTGLARRFPLGERRGEGPSSQKPSRDPAGRFRRTSVRSLRLAFAAALGVSSTASAAGPVWLHSGPDGGKITAIAVSPANPAKIYAASWGAGVFKTTDRAASWTAINNGLAYPAVFSLAVDPSQDDTVYAGTGAGVSKSVDGGASWSNATTGLTSFWIEALTIDPSHPRTLYAATADAGVFKTTDAAGHWTQTTLTTANITALAIDPVDSEVVYAGSYSGVFQTTDGGATWTPRNNGLFDTSVRRVVIDPDNRSTLYAATIGGFGGVFKSIDSGASWTLVSGGFPDPYVVVLGLARGSPSALYAGTPTGGVFKSIDGGATWNAVNTGLEPVAYIFLMGRGGIGIDPADPATVYLGLMGAGIFKTVDSGQHWTSSCSGTRSADAVSLAIDPLSPATVYAAASMAGFFKSTNHGRSWTRLESGIPQRFLNSVVLDPIHPTTLYLGLGDFGILKSIDAGANWTPANVGLPASPGVRRLTADPVQSGTVYAHLLDGSALYKTTNGGSSWAPANGGLPSTEVRALAIHPGAPSVLYAGTYGAGVFKTSNGGSGWVDISGNLPEPYIEDLVIDPSDPNTLYAATNQHGVWKTTGGGPPWSFAASGLQSVYVTTLAIDPARPNVLYGGTTTAGVYRTVDGGQSWSPFNTGMGSPWAYTFAGPWVYSLAVDPTDSRRVYAGAIDGGVFSMDPGPFQFFTLAPCRILDTRTPSGPYGGPALSAGATRNFALSGQCGIPSSARAVSINVTAVQATAGPGYLTIYPGATPLPPTSTLNYPAGKVRANNAVMPLGALSDIDVFCGQGAGAVHLIVDVNGYFQ